jgi:hypothetical protein
MPNRMLRDWTDSQKFDGISSESERLFVRLIMKSDDFGRYYGDTRLIRAHCFPLLDNLRANDLDRWLDDLSHRQLILRYETKGRKYLAITNYGQRLRSHHAKFPPPDGEKEDWLPPDSDPPQVAVMCRPEVEEKRSRREVEVEGENVGPPLNEFDLAAMSSEAQAAEIQRHHPDIDIRSEWYKLKRLCDKDGTGPPTIRQFLGWLKKASPKAKKPPLVPKINISENAHPRPLTEEEQRAMWEDVRKAQGA